MARTVLVEDRLTRAFAHENFLTGTYAACKDRKNQANENFLTGPTKGFPTRTTRTLAHENFSTSPMRLGKNLGLRELFDRSDEDLNQQERRTRTWV